ncbi:MAG: YceD family protein, partial [Rhodoferax sp.]|nr:YceD family protein [Rhodoferax sp.]
MKHDYAAQHLPITAFAQNQGSLAGQATLGQFERLLALSQGQGDATQVVYSARGEMRPDAAGKDQPWLFLSGHTTLSLVCQRCLEPVAMPISFDRPFRFVATEALAEVEDEESEEDVLVISKAFDVLELLEDELLLACPLVPMHSTCPQPVRMQAADADFAEPVAEKP